MASLEFILEEQIAPALKSIAASLEAMAHPVVIIPAPKNGICPKCGGKIAIRNPTGKCDHLYYPDYIK